MRLFSISEISKGRCVLFLQTGTSEMHETEAEGVHGEVFYISASNLYVVSSNPIHSVITELRIIE